MDNRTFGDVATSRVVANHPIVAASEPGKVTVEYLPVGYIFNVLPMRLADGNIYLGLNMTMSDVLGEEIIGGNTYPVISSCIFSAPLTFRSGESVVINGLEIERTPKLKKTAITVFVTVDAVQEMEIGA